MDPELAEHILKGIARIIGEDVPIGITVQKMKDDNVILRARAEAAEAQLCRAREAWRIFRNHIVVPVPGHGAARKVVAPNAQAIDDYEDSIGGVASAPCPHEAALCRAREWLVTAKTLNGTECSYHDPHRKKYAIKERCGKCILCLIDYAMTVHLNDAPCPHEEEAKRLLLDVYQILPGEDADGRKWRQAFADADSSRMCAETILTGIEELFPNWKSYRNLDDCIRCELALLRSRAGREEG